ncbi:MAG: hemolysin [Burkholderia sp.]|nr:hemolysin [Burkholderia sp.]
MSDPTINPSSGHIKTIAAVVAMAAGVGIAGYLALGSGEAVTDDAYVDGNIVQVTPQQNGSVTLIAADNTDFVQAGQLLVQFNEIDTQLALERAKAQLSRAVRQVRVQFANAGQMQANVALRRADLAKVEADLARRTQLAASGAVSGEDVVHAQDAVNSARAALTVALQQLASSDAMIDRTSIDNHPDVQSAVAQLREAYVASARTSLRAPVSGIVSKRSVQLGQRVSAGSAVMSIVPPEQVWVNANFKESQLRHLRIGQAVLLTADVYGKSVRYAGRIVGFDAGTGNAFSLMPAQNASGNWIKVTQRVPVRIALDDHELRTHPLKLGMSMHVEVDTRETGAATLPVQRRTAQTAVFSTELEQADRVIAQIIADNAGHSPAFRLAHTAR